MSFDASQISDRDRVLEASDLVAVVSDVVPLKQRGREHVGLCPFHDDHSPSMSVVTHKGNAFYKCFSCGAGGNAIDFMIHFHRMTFREALEALAKRFGVVLTGTGSQGGSLAPIRRALQIGLEWYRKTLLEDDGRDAREAIAARHISKDMVEQFQLGASSPRRDRFVSAMRRRLESERDAGRPITEQAFMDAGLVMDGRDGLRDAFPHRLIFPILNESGDPIAFGARRLNDAENPKYLNSPESPLFHKSKALYGIHAARAAIVEAKVAVVTEGYTDVIACHQAGIRNVVATLGTALTTEHARALSRLADRVVLLFDADDAGRKAADRATEVCFRERVDILIATIRGGKDPDELLRQPDGIVAMRETISAARPALEVAVSSLRDRLAASTGTSDRQRAIEDLLQRLVQWGLNDAEPIRRGLLLDDLARATGLPRVTIEEGIARFRTAARPSPRVATQVKLDPRLDGSEAMHGRAQRIAEEDLLVSMLMAPAACLGSFASPDGETASLAELLDPAAFGERPLAQLYARMLERIESGREPAVQYLLDEVDGGQRVLLLNLAAKAAQRAELSERARGHGADPGAASTGREPIADSLRTVLLRLQAPDGTGRASGPNGVAATLTPTDAQARLDAIRHQGHRPTAMTVIDHAAEIRPR
ncbi:MAG: DNA primase [Planctomycetota bacterium]|nr:DNA primase [Planctomycetota bacterium]